MEQQVAMGGVGNESESSSESSSEIVPVNQQAPVVEASFVQESKSAEKIDLLTSLEQRWDALAGMIRDLRSENAALREELREKETQIERGEQDAAQLREQLDGLAEEKKRTIARIEGLLARFDDIGQ